MPKRLQRKRTKGFRLPEGTISVTRPGRWGNPFRIGKPGPLGRVAPDAEGAVGLFADMLADPKLRKIAGYPEDLEPLRGHDLACFCREDAPCHADVLLFLANETDTFPNKLPLHADLEPEPGAFRKARGILKLGEPSEDAIRRLRDGW